MWKQSQLIDALEAEGYEVTSDAYSVTARKQNEPTLRFGRQRGDDHKDYTFSTNDPYTQGKVKDVQSRYNQIGVRAALKKRGYVVADSQNEGRKLVFIKRGS